MPYKEKLSKLKRKLFFKPKAIKSNKNSKELSPKKKSITNENDELIRTIESIVNTKSAILFVGSGFSLGSTNIKNESPTTAKGLAKQIAKIGKFEDEDDIEDLAYVSDLFFTYEQDKSKLVEMLKDSFTIKETSENHQKIISLPWRRVYTTNYDNCIEHAASKNNKSITSVNLNDPTSYSYRENICLHINGSIDKLTPDDLNNSFKLTNSSYNSPENLLNSPWYRIFKSDIEHCSVLVFIGYSLYDIDIRKILFNNELIHQKTIFITSENPTRKTKFILSKFGEIFNIGVNGFAQIISTAKIEKDENHDILRCLEKPEIKYKEQEIKDTDIIRFLDSGKLKECYMTDAISSSQEVPYLSLRKNDIEKILNTLDDKNGVIICAELGNGKSTLLDIIINTLLLEGNDVLRYIDTGHDYKSDLTHIRKTKKPTYISVDNYTFHHDFIQDLLPLVEFNKNIYIILTAREGDNQSFKYKYENINLPEIDVNKISNTDVEFFIKIIDSLGFWGDNAKLPISRKKLLLSKDNKNNTISHILYSIFESTQIGNKINELITNIKKEKEYFDVIFCLCLLETIKGGENTSKSILSDLCGNSIIYESKFYMNTDVIKILNIDGQAIYFRSSIMAMYIIRNHYTSKYMIDKILEIVKNFYEIKSESSTHLHIYQSLLRFSFLERIMPDKNKKDSLVDFYNRLKRTIPWMKNNPHYWLQYGMARLTYKDLDIAEKYFKTAYSLAENITDYETYYLDNQYARLLLLKSITQTSDSNDTFLFFQEANRLLSKNKNDVYKFRQVRRYDDVYKAIYPILTKKNKTIFEHSCKNMLKALNDEMPYLDEVLATNEMFKCKFTLEKIVNDIENNRKKPNF